MDAGVSSGPATPISPAPRKVKRSTSTVSDAAGVDSRTSHVYQLPFQLFLIKDFVKPFETSMTSIAATTHSTVIDIGRYHVTQADMPLNHRKPPNLRKDQEWINYVEGPLIVRMPQLHSVQKFDDFSRSSGSPTSPSSTSK